MKNKQNCPECKDDQFNGYPCRKCKYTPEEYFEIHFNGSHWIFNNKKTNESLSVILNSASYGSKIGLFETQCSWLSDVQGYLTFAQVAQKIKRLKRGKK